MSWTADATEPTEEETQILEGLGARVREQLVEATEPLELEVQRVRFERPVSSSPRWIPVTALALALAAGVLLAVGLSIGAPPVYTSDGDALTRTFDDGVSTRVVQVTGRRTYDVTPVRPSGTFSVVVGDVTVTVLGTKFTVVHEAHDTTVDVLQGRVQVDHPWGRDVLSAGDHWSRAAVRPSLVVAPGGGLRHVVRTQQDVGDGLAAVREETVVPETVDVVVAEPSVVAEPPVASEPLESAGPPPLQTDPQRFAALLDRFDAGERSSALVGELGAFISDTQSSALGEEAEVLALLVGATAWPAQAALDAIDAWLVRHPRHPDEVRVLVARATLAHRRLGRCDLAVPTYRRLGAGTTGRLRTWAARQLAQCDDLGLVER